MFNFVKEIAGKRDFYIDTSIYFDVYNNENKNLKSNISFEATIVNLEKYDIILKSPNFLNNISIEANLLNSATYYRYNNYTISNISDFDITLIYEIIKTISSFLSSNLFTIFDKNDKLSLIPAGYSFLKRLGLEPTKITVSFNGATIKQILFSTDNSTESILIKFNKFKILKEDF
ncbi:hypothetical protein SU69_07045 [Thermosipho melanesiensis]|uniref:Uncharacterized protein n=1 Tax=Thermosipho melanesiensis TaxID=46541 RepID=A0ABM6GFJ4_9BACT|nr:hypothetical protein BW47_07370 [Thermosipho melanesiensis]OOC36797.1 hypothetical protein SU68_07115 [Thermosipho melanesiensis]OOC37334.1 hypothetical protein SU69_07045 [Thermosipho melanesiensis]OOC38086.1 hypothetical protein SU70_07055 [Thermosipho melanesiensis]OOC41315.1 hypothetical protein SU71_07035 [Thermosipho melanesiensis]